jgi:predicted DNA-binding transcriptional regulator YafY
MPVDKQVLLRYRVLNECFRNRHREYTIDDLVNECNKALRAAGKPDVSKRTVQYDINELEGEPYCIRLNENLKRGRQRLYRYVNTDDSISLYRMDDEERDKIEDAIFVLKKFKGEPIYDWVRNVLMQVEAGLFDEATSSFVSFQTNPDLKGLEHFAPLLHAIITKRVLKLTYTPFGKDTIIETIYPHYLKQYNDRWYLIAIVKESGKIGNYPLDRIDGFEDVALPFKDSDIDFDEYFDDVIGVTVNPEEPVDIFIKVSRESIGYVKTKPLHLTQHTMEEHDDYMVIKINVIPNYELDSKILSFGTAMEILSPESYRAHIAEKIHAMNEKYTDNAENLHRK